MNCFLVTGHSIKNDMLSIKQILDNTSKALMPNMIASSQSTVFHDLALIAFGAVKFLTDCKELSCWGLIPSDNAFSLIFWKATNGSVFCSAILSTLPFNCLWSSLLQNFHISPLLVCLVYVMMSTDILAFCVGQPEVYSCNPGHLVLNGWTKPKRTSAKNSLTKPLQKKIQPLESI